MDWRALRLAAHALRGAAETCFVSSLGRACHDLEKAAAAAERGSEGSGGGGSGLGAVEPLLAAVREAAQAQLATLDALKAMGEDERVKILTDVEGYVAKIPTPESAAAQKRRSVSERSGAPAPAAACVDEAAAAASAADLVARLSASGLGGKKSHLQATGRLQVLVADDAEATNMLMRHGLESLDFDVLTVASAEAALQALAECAQLPDAVLMDVHFGPACMTGFDACAALRQAGATKERLPVIMLSATSSSVHVQRAFAAGANESIQKPAAAAEICARVNHLVGAAGGGLGGGGGGGAGEEASRKRKAPADWWINA